MIIIPASIADKHFCFQPAKLRVSYTEMCSVCFRREHNLLTSLFVNPVPCCWQTTKLLLLIFMLKMIAANRISDKSVLLLI